MSSLTEFVTKPDWCRCSLKNKIRENDQGNNYLGGLDDEIMKGVYA